MEGLTDQEHRQIEDELNAAIDQLIEGCTAMNMESAFAMFSDAPGFLMMGTDGTLCDFQTYLKNNIDYFAGCESFRLETFKREIRVVNSGAAVFSWAYGVEAKLITGESDVIRNAGASFVFHKIRNEWKVVYYHESSTPPQRIGTP